MIEWFRVLRKDESITKNAVDKAAGSFANYLENQLEAVREAQLHSKNITKDFMMGKVDNLHDVMIAGEKAGLAMKTMNTLREESARSLSRGITNSSLIKFCRLIGWDKGLPVARLHNELKRNLE